jgi:hypothetical protein
VGSAEVANPTHDAVKLAARVRELLVDQEGELVEKSMMGALAFTLDGAMCCSVGKQGLLERVTPAEREELLADEHEFPMHLGARTMKGFVRVAPEGTRPKAALRKWIARGIAASRAAGLRAPGTG